MGGMPLAHATTSMMHDLRAVGSLALATLALTWALTDPSAEAGERAREREELIVQVKPGISEPEAEEMFASEGASPVEEIPQIRARVIRVPEAAVEHVREALSHRHEVESVERNLRVEPALTANDPLFQWHLNKISAPAAWDLSSGSTQDAIAILDSGVDPSHPDLAAKLLAGWNFYDNNADWSDVYGHGTKVAGAAAAISNNGIGVAGIAWQNPILPVRVSDPAGYAYLSTIAHGLTWAVDHGARVMNVSFGSIAASSTIRSAAQYVHDHGGLVVAAAGNCACDDATPENPYVLSVAATDPNDQLASFSSRGTYVDLAAPGTGIWTTTNGGGYTGVAGTSFSSPITAGVVALMWSVNPGLTPDEIVMLLEQTSVDLGSAGYDTSFGFGRIDANAAVRAAAGTEAPPPDTTAPSVSITSPTAGATVSGSATVQAMAFDNIGVASVQFRVDGVSMATATAAPFSFAWDTKTVANGSHVVDAVAFDAAGNSSVSLADSLTVSNTTKGNGKRRR
jgi:subtilisin family serine protease